MSKPMIRVSVIAAALACFGLSCSSTPEPVKTQAYAQLQKERTLEHEFPAVWKGLEAALKDHKIVERDPETVETQDWSKLEARSLETDWIYTQSRDKYVEFKVNNFPRKQYLQMRYRYRVKAKRILGGTHLTVEMDEQLERLDANGKATGYTDSEKPDSSRANGLIEATDRAVLAAAP